MYRVLLLLLAAPALAQPTPALEGRTWSLSAGGASEHDAMGVTVEVGRLLSPTREIRLSLSRAPYDTRRTSVRPIRPTHETIEGESAFRIRDTFSSGAWSSARISYMMRQRAAGDLAPWVRLGAFGRLGNESRSDNIQSVRVYEGAGTVDRAGTARRETSHEGGLNTSIGVDLFLAPQLTAWVEIGAEVGLRQSVSRPAEESGSVQAVEGRTIRITEPLIGYPLRFGVAWYL
jgi:hypothetical protein